MTTLAGGWTLVMNINPSDGNRVSFTNTTFWQSNAEYGDFTNHFTNDYKSPAAFGVVGTNVMVQVAQPGAGGAVIGWKAWSMALKSFDTFFDSAANTVQTMDEIGSNVAAVYDYEPVIKFGTPKGTGQATQLISNRAINMNADRVRLGASGYSTSDNNEPGLGTQMEETVCGAGNNCYRHRDVELRVAGANDTWCNAPTVDGTFKWVGTDGGCGGNCGGNNCFGVDGQYPTQVWTYRIYVR